MGAQSNPAQDGESRRAPRGPLTRSQSTPLVMVCLRRWPRARGARQASPAPGSQALQATAPAAEARPAGQARPPGLAPGPPRAARGPSGPRPLSPGVSGSSPAPHTSPLRPAGVWSPLGPTGLGVGRVAAHATRACARELRVNPGAGLTQLPPHPSAHLGPKGCRRGQREPARGASGPPRPTRCSCGHHAGCARRGPDLSQAGADRGQPQAPGEAQSAP